jgi:hypothetical protein
VVHAMNKNGKRKLVFGQEILGPIFYDFCQKLYLYQYAFKDNAVCLYASRGGFRLYHLFEKYLKNKNVDPPVPQIPFLISRILSIKGTIISTFDKAEKFLLREFFGSDARYFLSCLCTGLKVDIDENIAKTKVDRDFLKQALHGDSDWAKKVQKYFKTQNERLSEYLGLVTKSAKNVLFVDTGWSGTTQSFLSEAFPEKQWYGLYFGKWDTHGENPHHFKMMTGIGVEGSVYHKKYPEDAILEYHHIIEGPLEPEFPSVEHLVRDTTGNICSSSKVDMTKISPQDDEPIFEGICRFFDMARGVTISELSKRLYYSRKELQRKILYPQKSDIEIMDLPPRSSDLGRKRFVPILHVPAERNRRSFRCKITNIRKSIWKQGKIVEEFPVLHPLLLLFYNHRYLAGRNFVSVLRKTI